MQLKLCKTELCCLQTTDYIPSAVAPWQSGHALQQCPQQEQEAWQEQEAQRGQGHQWQG